MTDKITIPFDGKHFVAGEISASVFDEDRGPRPRSGIVIWYEDEKEFMEAASVVMAKAFEDEGKQK